MSSFQLENSITIWHVIAFLLLTALFIFWEYKKAKSWLNYVVTVLLCAAIAIIFLRPVAITPKPFNSIVLIGEGVTQDRKDSLYAQSKYPVYSINELGFVSQANNYSKEQGSGLRLWDKQIDTLFSIGHIAHVPLNFKNWQTIDQPVGYQINYSKEIKLGDSLKLDFINTGKQALTIKVELADKPAEKRKIFPGEKFTLRQGTQAKGNYQSVIYLNDSLEYHLNTHVIENEPIRIKLLAATPDFEWRFLNNYLGSKGHAISWDTEVSTDIYKKQLTNWPDSLNSTSKKADFTNYDLIILDLQVWNSLSYAQQNTLVKLEKAGNSTLIFRANENTLLKDKTGLLPPQIVGGQAIESKQLKYINSSKSLKWRRHDAYQYLYTEKGHSLGFISLQNSYIWQLSGEQAKYDQFWEPFINELLQNAKKEYYFYEDLAFAKNPFRISKWSALSANTLRILQPNGDTLELETNGNSLMLERSDFVFYPDEMGWYSLIIKDGLNRPFYVHPTFMVKEDLGQVAYQYNYKKSLKASRQKTAGQSELTTKEDLRIWFFIFVALCLAYLWVEEKMS